MATGASGKPVKMLPVGAAIAPIFWNNDTLPAV